MVEEIIDELNAATAIAYLDQTPPHTMYDVIFSAKRLGLGLTKEGGQNVVSSTQHPTVVKMGDILIEVASENVQYRSQDYIRKLLLVAESQRPITIKFVRTKQQPSFLTNRDYIVNEVMI